MAPTDPARILAPDARPHELVLTESWGGFGGAAPISPAIHTDNLRKQYRNTVALKGLSMTVNRGEVFGFLGPNGAGKTTAVKLLLGLVHATSGEAMVLGAPRATSRPALGSVTCPNYSDSKRG
jgi:ABC-type multidrug transport system fused ATPase/permease subunit